ncbi:hypothetical protein Glove_165g129 [Diversispora epigaea]|uniref:Uncharacterized protein n=1 Tax=Diversispora epigaea TaxID=1348612 RepID=A0A397IQV3_9GLOM|nr:hypothetical protein Glove_165g129 [Diversispora epigaea]
MSLKLKRFQKKKFVDVPSTSGTLGASIQGTDTEVIKNISPPQKEPSMFSGFENLQLGHPYKIWVKYNNNQPAKIIFDGEDVYDLKKAIKNNFPNDLAGIDAARIILRRHGEEKDLNPGFIVNQNFENNSSTPLQVIVNAPVLLKRKREISPENLSKIVETAIEKILSQEKYEIIQASNISETKAENIIDSLGLKNLKFPAKDFQPIDPISCEPFVWNKKIDEAHQMSSVKKWFKKALVLPKGFQIRDIHTQNHRRQLRNSNFTLTSSVDISIGPNDINCVWIETKKKKKYFKEVQIISELFLIDKISVLKSMAVLTDCKNNWVIYFFMKSQTGNQYLASSKIDDRSIALAIIKQFVLDEGKFIHDKMGKNITYQVNLPKPLKMKSKFLEILEEDNNKMADMIDNMTEKELFNMSMRKRLRIAKMSC